MILFLSGTFNGNSVKTDSQVAQNQTLSGKPQQITDLENKVMSNPNDMKLLLELAHTLADNGFYEDGISKYKLYLEKNPNETDVIVDMGVCYFNLNKLDEAREVINKALSINPDHQIGTYNLGIISMSQGNREEAEKMFKRVISLNPDSELAKNAEKLINSHK